MIYTLGAGPYVGPGTTYKFGNTLLTVPTQFVVSGNGGDVRGAGNWITSLGGIAGDRNSFFSKLQAIGYTSDAAVTAAGYKIGQFGWLWVLLPLPQTSPDGSQYLYDYLKKLMLAQQPPGGSPPGGSPPGGSPPGGGPPGGGPPAKAGNWLTKSTIAGIPNWEIVAGGLAAFIIRKKLVK